MSQSDTIQDLLDLAAPYALHAVDEAERHDIESSRAAAASAVRAEFDELVRGYR